MRTRSFLRAGAIAVVAVVLTACGSDETTEPGNGQQADPGEPQSGGSAAIVQLTEPRSLDPALLGNTVVGNTLVGNSLYGFLVAVDADGDVEYGLAERLETTDGGTTWQLTLRDGLTFTDGTPLDAAAVQFNWERIKDPATGSPAVGDGSFLDSMTASGQTLDVTLTVPIAQFENVIAESLNWIGSPTALQAGPQTFNEDPVGAGPFLLDSWQRGGEMVLVRNDEYFDSPRPHLDELVLTANGDTNQRLSTVTSGGVDGAVGNGPDVYARAVDQGLNTVLNELSGGNVWAMNTRIAPFDDVRARQAVVQAIDLDAVNDAAYEGQGIMPESLFSEGSPYSGDARLLGFDADAAQELFDELAEEGTPVGFTITAYQTTENRRSAEAIQAQLNQYDNVSVELEILDFPAATAKSVQRTFQVIASGVTFANPSTFLYRYLHSDSPGNLTGIDDPELDAALEAGLSATDDESRTQAYQDVAGLYGELEPGLLYVRSIFALIHTDRLQGVEMYASQAVRTDTMWVTG